MTAMDGSSNSHRKFLFFLPAILGALLVSCSRPMPDISSELGRRAILDETYLLIDSDRCDEAIDLIEPLYKSRYTSNEVRMAMASAHACFAGVNFFDLINGLMEADLGGSISNLWPFLARSFPSTISDTRSESSWAASESLMAMLKPGMTLASAYQINAGTRNEGSTRVQDRITRSNTFLIFTSMATLGTLMNRYSDPHPTTFLKREVLGYVDSSPDGWASAINMNEEGCSFAGSLKTMVETVSATSSEFTADQSSALAPISTLDTLLDAACELGCQASVVGGFDVTGCAGIPVGACNPCPITMKKRDSCTGATNDVNSCAAAGLVHFINTSLEGWQDSI